MIANISPSSSCTEHTLNSLRYADRVKELRKEKNENFVEKESNDLLSQMLMPRNHNTTVKYNVETKRQSNNEKVDKDNNKGGVHINDIYQPQNQNKIHNSSNSKPKVQNNNNIIANINAFSNNNTNINNYINKNNKNTNNIINNNTSNKSKYKNIVINNEDDLQKLSNEHEKLINTILNEEEDFISDHRKHIDDVVELVKQEMILINEVDKPGSDIDIYVSSLDKLLKEKEEKIQGTRSRLKDFNNLLRDEEYLSQLYFTYQQKFGINDNRKSKDNVDDFDDLLDDK